MKLVKMDLERQKQKKSSSVKYSNISKALSNIIGRIMLHSDAPKNIKSSLVLMQNLEKDFKKSQVLNASQVLSQIV